MSAFEWEEVVISREDVMGPLATLFGVKGLWLIQIEIDDTSDNKQVAMKYYSINHCAKKKI